MDKEAGKAKTVAPQPAGRRSKLRRFIWGMLITLALLYVIGPRLAAPFVRARLQKMVSQKLNAELTMADLAYRFPYGVVAKDAALVTKDADGKPIDLLRVKELRLSLVALPFGDGPLLIEKIAIKDPTANLIMNEDGVFVGFKGLVKDETEELKEQTEQQKKPGKEKPSDYFRLRRLEMTGGQITYLDRRSPAQRDVVWKDLGVELNISPTSGAVYGFDIMARQMPLSVTNVRGKLNIDEARLEVEKYVIAVKTEGGREYPVLPPGIAQFLQQNNIEGSMSLSGQALIPLKEPWRATHESVLDLPLGRGRFSTLDGVLDRVSVKLRISSEIPPAQREEMEKFTAANAIASTARSSSTSPAPNADPSRMIPAFVSLEKLEISSGTGQIRFEKGSGIVDPASGRWRLKDIVGRVELGKDHKLLPGLLRRYADRYDLSGKLNFSATAAGPLTRSSDRRLLDEITYDVAAYPRDVTFTPKNWPLQLDRISGTVRANAHVISFENVEAHYGADKVFVLVARLPMGGLDEELRLEEIAGTVVAAGKDQPYPKFLKFVGEQLHPMGSLAVAGHLQRPRDLPPGQKPEFVFNIIAKDAALALTNKRVPVTDVQAEVIVSPVEVRIKRAEGNSLGGNVVAKGTVITPGKGVPANYELEGWARSLDLRALARVLAEPGKPPLKMSGRGNANGTVRGLGTSDEKMALEALTADGKFEVLEGEFWEVPVLKEIVGGTKVTREALTAAQAAGTFDIRQRRVELKQAAISAPVLGIQGGGTIGFDGKLEMRAVAAPLADWKDQMKRTRIPILSDVAGELLGGLQTMLNAASKTLLYEFKITGTLKERKMETVPAPVLTEGLAQLFNAMLKGENLSGAMEKK